jgi:2-polyprenyl-3-methyl-5-hydroxy-6-metoxy-1,4-benzoquinol methylase
MEGILSGKRVLRATCEDDPDFQRFVQAVASGASLQDIYVDSQHGLAARRDEDHASAATQAAIRRRALVEFERVHHHYSNLVEPLDDAFGIVDRRVLDFGCGSGALAVAVAAAGAQVVAVDPTPASLRATKARAAYHGVGGDAVACVHVSPGFALPFADRSFERVIANSVLEFIPRNRDACIRELLRLVEPGGLLVLSTQNGWFPRDYYTGLWFPRLRRSHCLAQNLPYGATWLEIRRWAAASGRSVRDLSIDNRFNSLDKLARRWMHRRRPVAALLRGANAAFRQGCRTLRLPSDVFLPYATWVLQVDG